MATLQRIDSHPDLADRVYRQLLNAICAGDFAPGARITQDELAARLNVSRQPIHQALRILKREGFVTDAGKRGLMVAALDARSVEQLYQVRGALDGLAARLAAQAGSKLDASLIEEGRQAAASRQVAAMIAADMRFHEAIYAASGNCLIADTAGKHWHHIGRAMGAVLQPAGMGAAVWSEHAAILEAINSGEPAQAELLARGHCDMAGRRLGQQLHDIQRQEKSA